MRSTLEFICICVVTPSSDLSGCDVDILEHDVNMDERGEDRKKLKRVTGNLCVGGWVVGWLEVGG